MEGTIKISVLQSRTLTGLEAAPVLEDRLEEATKITYESEAVSTPGNSTISDGDMGTVSSVVSKDADS